ncbi:MAG: ABC transporter substrate-binding protein [Deltaproteobacteria bacterium]|nr:ABC transporter substrate-binding protein [Deltaproteobacteria bacterium]
MPLFLKNMFRLGLVCLLSMSAAYTSIAADARAGKSRPASPSGKAAERGRAVIAPDRTLKLAVPSDIVSLDPHVQLSEETLAYSHLVFDPLFRRAADARLEPRLAERWEQVDPTTIRFYLRKNVKFHSGNTMTAGDVVWTLHRLKSSEEYRGLFRPFVRALAVDEHTVDIVTDKPYAMALGVAAYIFVMDSGFYSGMDENGRTRDVIDKTGLGFAGVNASGTGPFRVESRRQGMEMTLKAFADYWGPRGNVGSIRVAVVNNGATRVASLLSGASDMIMSVPTGDYARLKGNKRLQLVVMNSSRLIIVQMNGKRRKELADPRVREAIVRATDNAAMVRKIMHGHAVPATQQIPPHMTGHNPELKPRYNLDKARRLLQEAGYPDGLELTMISPNNRYVNDEKIALTFVGMLAKAGIKVSLRTMPRIRYWDEFGTQSADLQLMGWQDDTEDAGNFSEYLLMCPDREAGYGKYNSGNYCNRSLDELVLACQSEFDPDKRAAMLREIEKIAYDDAAFVPLHFEPHTWAADARLKNLRQVLNAMNFSYLGDLIME